MAKPAPFFRPLLVIATLFLLGPSASADNNPSPQQKDPASKPQPPTQTEQYLALAGRTLEGIRAQESNKDATCWTTVRMMDNFYAMRPIDETAIFLKFEIMKSLLLKLWRSADSKARGEQVDLEAAKKVIPQSVQDEIPAVDPTSILDLDPSIKTSIADFHRITENWRILVSVLFEQLAEREKSEKLKIPTNEAADLLAKALTVINIRLLREAKTHADAAHHEKIMQEDLKAAYQTLLTDLKLPRDTAAITTPSNGKQKPSTVSKETRKKLFELTRQNIDNKVAALTKWNGVAFDPSKDYPTMLERVNKISPMPVTEDGLIAVLEELRTIAKLVAQGKRPMRPDTMSTSGQMFWSDIPGNPAYLQVEWIWNVLEEIFPRRTDISGDLEVSIAPSPSKIRTNDQEKAPSIRNVFLRGYELDAMRDTTIHWSTLKDVYSENSDLFPLEPFAGELLAERLSEIAFFLIKEGQRNAEAAGADSIDAASIGSLFKRSTLLVAPPRPEYGWTGDYSKEKSSVLKEYPPKLFEDISAGSGIRTPDELIISAGKPRKTPFTAGVGISLITLFGSGIGVGDYNNDKLPDLLLGGDYRNRLYRNLGNYKFEDVTDLAGLNDRGNDSRQPLFADVDNDGRLDILIIHSASATKLFLQTTEGKFVDKTSDSGIKTNDFAVVGVFFDYDNDGLLDLFVGNYTGLLPMLGGKNGSGNQLYHNLGSGRFKNVTAGSGLGSTTLNVAATALDYDSDGWMDLFIANDFGEDELYRNIDGKRFENIAEDTGADDRGSGMNAAVADINYDGRPDLYVTVVDMFSKSIGFKFPVASSTIKLDDRIMKTSFYLTGNKLLENQNGAEFKPVEHLYFEPGDRGWGWGTSFFDYDNDGDEDMYLANGWVEGTLAANQQNQMFVRDKDRFYLASPKSPEAFAENSRSVATADLAGTGRTDLIVSNYDTPLKIFKNASTNSNHWLKVRLNGTKSNRFGIGAQVRLIRAGLPTQTRYLTAGGGFLSQQEPVATFGLGQNDKVERIEVIWPGGAKTAITPTSGQSEVVINQ